MSTFTDRFAGKTYVVTGAGSGIGRATAARLVAEGAVVIAADVVAERLDSLVAELGSAYVRPVLGDLTHADTISAILEAGHGEITGAVLVAGVHDHWQPAAEIDDEIWQRVFDVNVVAPMRLTRALLPQMLERGWGKLVYMSSEAGFRSSISGAAYTSSKHALNGFVKSVAFYYGPKGISANAVAPGGVNTAIETPFASDYALERTRPILENVPPASVDAEVIAAPVLWLLSDDSPNINGVILPSDNAWTTI